MSNNFEIEHEIIERLMAAGWSCAAHAVIAAWDRGSETALDLIEVSPLVYLPIPLRTSNLRYAMDGPVERTESRCEYRKEIGRYNDRMLVRVLGRVSGCSEWIEVSRHIGGYAHLA